MIQNFLRFFFPTLTSDKEPERARDERGRLVGDDKKTPTFNEAWVGGQAPAKKTVATTAYVAPKAAPKKRGRPKGSKNGAKK